MFRRPFPHTWVNGRGSAKAGRLWQGCDQLRTFIGFRQSRPRDRVLRFVRPFVSALASGLAAIGLCSRRRNAGGCLFGQVHRRDHDQFQVSAVGNRRSRSIACFRLWHYARAQLQGEVETRQPLR